MTAALSNRVRSTDILDQKGRLSTQGHIIPAEVTALEELFRLFDQGHRPNQNLMHLIRLNYRGVFFVIFRGVQCVKQSHIAKVQAR
jgi:hypothetical protein